jgi:DNA-binding Lrp family transcriptional regulator
MSQATFELQLLNDYQRSFPLVPEPYAVIARQLAITEPALLANLQNLQANGKISRIGAVYRPHVLGHSTLAALACPPGRLESVARQVGEYREVNHNYEREHEYNLWFVVTAPSRAGVDRVLDDIRLQTGLRLLDLPMLADYHIDLGFDLTSRRRAHQDVAGALIDAAMLRVQLEPVDFELAAALETGLSLGHRPFKPLAASCGLDEEACLQRIQHLLDLSVIRRFGIVVRHRELGFRANAMVVWDVPDELIETVGRRLGRQDGVTLCYQRPRRLPEWPYNLFSMLHGQDRVSVLARLDELRRDLELTGIPCRPLFSLRRFKQCGAHYSATPAKVA